VHRLRDEVRHDLQRRMEIILSTHSQLTSRLLKVRLWCVCCQSAALAKSMQCYAQPSCFRSGWTCSPTSLQELVHSCYLCTHVKQHDPAYVIAFCCPCTST
jgi:hypothetical protein